MNELLETLTNFVQSRDATGLDHRPQDNTVSAPIKSFNLVRIKSYQERFFCLFCIRGFAWIHGLPVSTADEDASSSTVPSEILQPPTYYR